MSDFKCKILMFLIVLSDICDSSDIFHVNSAITFQPHDPAASKYFGFSVVLTRNSILVGAPKATNPRYPTMATGLVFKCNLTYLDHSNVTCYSLDIKEGIVPFKDDMWLGAALAPMPGERFVACAPRWNKLYTQRGNTHRLVYGFCYVSSGVKNVYLTPLDDIYRLAFKSNGSRPEYSEQGVSLHLFAYGQAGVSVAATASNSIIIGAPGVMEWAGTIVDYMFSTDPRSIYYNKQPVHNPYFTLDLQPDDYFGYSVESGQFEVNGNTLFVGGAPRGKKGYGQVLIYDKVVGGRPDNMPMNIKAKVIGPQLGSYFGASISCTDLNGDGVTDLLVGAPNYVEKDGKLHYDQGAVFVYLTGMKGSQIVLNSAGYVTGSKESGARFGTTVADLGDINGDGFSDVAIGSPWENHGLGVVYIYKGSKAGLHKRYSQRILSDTARGFGMSISKGVDIDSNHCNDLAIGAYDSSTVHLYRCIPTATVKAFIKVPDALNLQANATNFTAIFCISAKSHKLWSHVSVELKASITIDPDTTTRRAHISGDSEYLMHAKPGSDSCDEQVVLVKPSADLSKPITINFKLEEIEESTKFPHGMARVSEDSALQSTFVIQLMRDCGEDLTCTPWLTMDLVPFNREYVPGSEDRLGAILTIVNKGEPAYGAKVNLKLPLQPKKVPPSCTLEGFNMTCDVAAPLLRDKTDEWEIELEYVQNETTVKYLTIEAELLDALFRDNITETSYKRLNIKVTPRADFSVTGKALPNANITVGRDKLDEGANVTFTHSFEVSNFGPSNWESLEVVIEIPEKVTLASPIEHCTEFEYSINCTLSIPAKVSVPVVLPLQLSLSKHGQFLSEQPFYNATSIITLLTEEYKKMATVSSVITLEAATPIWPLIVGIVAGVLLLAAIVFGLYKFGFFRRNRPDDMKTLTEDAVSVPGEPGVSNPSIIGEESTLELISEDDEEQ